MSASLDARRCRWAVRVRGIVQGVGFRPAVYRLAAALELTGFVQNDANGVWLEIEGLPANTARFLESLPRSTPPGARVLSFETMAIAPLGEKTFRIVASDRSLRSAGAHESIALVPADLAPCEACLRELEDPRDRRFRYPFINCTACGPRFTLVRYVPYHRASTTMDPFALCDACRREYEDPRDRRFHAEPTACPACGPQLQLLRPKERVLWNERALRCAASALAAGDIVAIKGVGGFLLACDATNAGAVAKLRERKARPHRPFAVMVRSLEYVERIAILDDVSREALWSPARPIVLLPARAQSPLAPNLAPGLVDIGVFLPPSPLQHLLLSTGPPFQVMTSGNRSDEPLAKENDEAVEKLGAIADAFLLHDRGIHVRADDSVLRRIGDEMAPLRRARGFVLEPIPLLASGPPLIAVGAEQKSTITVVRDGQAYVSPHIGDLGHPDAYALFAEAIGHLKQLLGVTPHVVAHDFHPSYHSTQWATSMPLPRIEVQHHHAHVAACLAEHGRWGPVIGVVFDGTGYGTDGSLWGGEILEVDLDGFRRLGHLRPLPLPGGEAAIREPWRLAAAALLDAKEPLDLVPTTDDSRLRAVCQLIEGRLHTQEATGAGRWFDAVAALCGLRGVVTYDGQAAMELEAIASPDPLPGYTFVLESSPDGPFVIDLRPMVREVASDLRHGIEAAIVSASFHEGMAQAVRHSCRRVRADGGPSSVVLSGGCFQNRRLSERTRALLESDGLEVLQHRCVPAGDGGISLGQAAVASARLARRTAQGGL